MNATKTVDAEVLNHTPPTGGQLVAQQQQRPPLPVAPNLAAALSKAQRKVRAVANDARNDFHRYDYTSSEAIIEAAKDALSENGLALLPLEETLDGPRIETTVKQGKEESEARYELVCRFVLLHSSGESFPMLRHWPVCPEKGRPLDKATAAAATLCLSYLLRDLLLMPRINPEDEVSARDDRAAKQQAPEQPKPANGTHKPADKQKSAAEVFDSKLAVTDATLAKAGHIQQPGVLIRRVMDRAAQEKFPPGVKDWSDKQLAEAREWTINYKAEYESESARLASELARQAAEAVEAPPGNAAQFLERLRVLWELKWKARIKLPDLHKFFIQHGAAVRPHPYPQHLSEWSPAQVKKGWEELLPRVERQMEEAAAQGAA